MTLRTLSMVVAAIALAGCDVVTSMHGGAVAQPTEQASSAPTQNQRFSIDTPLGELARNAEAKAVLDRFLPGATEGPHGAMVAGYTLRQIQAQMPNRLSRAQLEQANRELAEIR